MKVIISRTKVEKIKKLVDSGKYFTINRARQYCIRCCSKIMLSCFLIFRDWIKMCSKMEQNVFGKNADLERSRFIKNGKLDMSAIFEGFIKTYNQVVEKLVDRFREEEGREFFLLYLKPIINGTGNFYIESQTRDQLRTDVIVDYLGEQYIIELKIWHGPRYNAEGEAQIRKYLDRLGLQTGYMLSFNFNENKEQGVKEIEIDGKKLIEATV